MRYNIYEGGNLRLTPWDPFIEAGLRPGDTHVEYAAHLKTKHKVVPFFMDNDGEPFQRFLRAGKQSDLIKEDIVAGDSLGIILLAEGTYIEHVVFHNKKAIKGGKLKFTIEGVAADTPEGTLVAAAQDARQAADEAAAAHQAAQEEANTALAMAISGSGSAADALAAQSAADEAKVAAQEAEKAAVAAEKAAEDAALGIGAVAQEFEVSLDYVGYTKVDAGLLLQTNGVIAVELVDSGEDRTGFQNQCWTLSPALVHHNDGHGCSCITLPCDTPYPEPEC